LQALHSDIWEEMAAKQAAARQIQDHAVSVRFLDDWLTSLENLRCDEDSGRMTFSRDVGIEAPSDSDAVDGIGSSDTGAQATSDNTDEPSSAARLSLVETLMLANELTGYRAFAEDLERHAYFGSVTHYVTYPFDCALRGLVSALRAHSKQQVGAGLPAPYYWIDLTSSERLDVSAAQDVSAALVPALQAASCTLLYMGDSGAELRWWSIVEMALGLGAGRELRVLLSEADEDGIIEQGSLGETIDRVLALSKQMAARLAALDVAEAPCWATARLGSSVESGVGTDALLALTACVATLLHDATVAALCEAISRQPAANQPTSLSVLALRLRESGSLAHALELFKQSKQAYERVGGAQCNIGRSLLNVAIVQSQLGQLEQAVASAQAGLQIFSDDAERRAKSGDCRGDGDNASVECAKAMQALGMMHGKMAQQKQALSWYSNADRLL
jgi:hypothetical protein